MAMTHAHPALDANAHAKSIIDAVTGHQPSPLDGEYLIGSAGDVETENIARKAPKHLGSKTNQTV